MTIYHCSIKTISRSAGRSATAAAAYRSGKTIEDVRTGQIHDFSKKGGVVSSDICLPFDASLELQQRSALWNGVESREGRRNSTVAREFEIALPFELNELQRKILALAYTKALVSRYGFAAECSIHKPGRGGDRRNHHAHILTSTRALGSDGFKKKIRALDSRKTGPQEVIFCRKLLADMTNAAFKSIGISEMVDHRSHVDRGLKMLPGVHLGPAATAIERRGHGSGRKSDISKRELDKKARGLVDVQAGEAAYQLAKKQVVELEKELAQWRTYAAATLEQKREILQDAEYKFQTTRQELTKSSDRTKSAFTREPVMEARRRISIEKQRLAKIRDEHSKIIATIRDSPIWKSTNSTYIKAKEIELQMKLRLYHLDGIACAPIAEDMPTYVEELNNQLAAASQVVNALKPDVMNSEIERRNAPVPANVAEEAVDNQGPNAKLLNVMKPGKMSFRR